VCCTGYIDFLWHCGRYHCDESNRIGCNFANIDCVCTITNILFGDVARCQTIGSNKLAFFIITDESLPFENFRSHNYSILVQILFFSSKSRLFAYFIDYERTDYCKSIWQWKASHRDISQLSGYNFLVAISGIYLLTS
jgi:hypothetical protein